MVFLYKVTVHTSWSQRGMSKRITRHEKECSIGKCFIFASRDMKQYLTLKNHRFLVRTFKHAQISEMFLRWTLKRFYIVKDMTHHTLAFLTFEVGYWANPNTTFLEPVKVDEAADCPRSYSKLFGEKRWSFCQKETLLSIFLSAKQAHINTDTYGAIRQALW